MNQQLQALAAQASASTACPPVASASINGHVVVARLARGFRNTGKDSIRWSVDGKPVAKAALINALNA